MCETDGGTGYAPTMYEWLIESLDLKGCWRPFHAFENPHTVASSVLVLARTGSKARIPFETFTDKYLRYVTHNINEHIPWYVFIHSFLPSHAERRRTTCMHSLFPSLPMLGDRQTENEFSRIDRNERNEWTQTTFSHRSTHTIARQRTRRNNDDKIECTQAAHFLKLFSMPSHTFTCSK